MYLDLWCRSFGANFDLDPAVLVIALEYVTAMVGYQVVLLVAGYHTIPAFHFILLGVL